MMYYINATWHDGTRETLHQTDDAWDAARLRQEYVLLLDTLTKSIWIEKHRILTPEELEYAYPEDAYMGLDRAGY